MGFVAAQSLSAGCVYWKSNYICGALLFFGWCFKVLRPEGTVSAPCPALCAAAVVVLGLAGLWADSIKLVWPS